MIKKWFRAFLAIVFLFAIAIALGAQNPNAADNDFASVKTLPPPGVTVGNAHLVRNSNGITCIIQTSGLVPGDVYSVWWVIPAEALIFNAAGSIAASDGTATFAGHASTGPIGPVDGSVVLSNGDGSFDNPRTDLVNVVVRHHGPPIPGIINQQMGTFNTGCGTGGCKNVQIATFVP